MSFDLERFGLWRITDSSGVSGKGWVAEGVRFSDGTAAMRWLTNVATTAVAPSVDHFNYIHGHGGHTRIAWIDNKEFSVGEEVLVYCVDEVLVEYSYCDQPTGAIGTVGHVDHMNGSCQVKIKNSTAIVEFYFDDILRLEPVLTEPPTL